MNATRFTRTIVRAQQSLDAAESCLSAGSNALARDYARHARAAAIVARSQADGDTESFLVDQIVELASDILLPAYQRKLYVR